MVNIFAATSADNNPGLGPISVVINSLWILFALVMLGVVFYYFRKWDQRAKFSSRDSTAPLPAPGTVNMVDPSEMQGHADETFAAAQRTTENAQMHGAMPTRR